ncbi:MAG: alpha/beta hydrolase [Acidimicrobiia bacterium]|nr:alpha/beta hydrolase [Acidimicrobiia bacterium]MYB74963.1 alpha/beta hydrolase [Acidimicrobiia bacterium]MYI00441.1 alpha/beta hydrolase [Acidimicrobiia bacterium]
MRLLRFSGRFMVTRRTWGRGLSIRTMLSLMADNRNLRADVCSHRSRPGFLAMSEPRIIASTKGAQVALHDLGGQGPPVLMTHANGFCGLMWQPVARELASVAHCLALDFRGHGDSVSGPDEDYHWDGMADDVLAAVEAIDPTPRLAVGHSLGGASILKAEQAQPGTFDRAWMFEPVTIPAFSLPRDGVMALGDIARMRKEVFESRQAAYDRYGSRLPFSLLDSEVLRAYVDHGFRDRPDGTVTMKCPRDVEATIFENPDRSAFDRLGEVATAVTVVVGTDADPPAMAAPLIAEQLPNATLERFDDLTHFGPFQDPPRIAAAISAALFSD